MPEGTAAAPARAARRRLQLTIAVAVLAGIDLLVKQLAAAALAGGPVGLPGIELRLLYNDGVAFSMLAGLPAGALVALTALMTAAMAAYALSAVPEAGRLRCVAGAAVLAGAVANLADRSSDGLVTDYLHTGWFPTFNLADIYLAAGVALLVLAEWRDARTSRP